MKKLNSIIRDLREDNDVKQETIANYLGVSQQTYSNYENDRREIPIEVVKKLANYYKVSTDYLLRSDAGYLGNLDMNAQFVENVTLHEVIYDMQALSDEDRKDLIKYIRFLHQDSNK